MKYWITIHAAACENAEFGKAAAANLEDPDRLFSCECIEEYSYANEVKLVVPEMFGIQSFTIRKHKYVTVGDKQGPIDYTSLDVLAFKEPFDYFEANLRFAKHQLNIAMDNTVTSMIQFDEYELFENMEHFDETVFKFREALTWYRGVMHPVPKVLHLVAN